jgi:hypothetical protein
MAQYTLRETRPEDEAALNALYRRLTGIARSGAQYAWEWRDGPLGPAPSWVVVDEDEDRLVAHHGVVPVPLVCDGTPLAAARTENTMLDPDYRGRVPYHAYEARILAELRKRFEVLFTTSGKGAWAAVRKRLGYRPVGTWRTFTLAATSSWLARRALGGVAPAGLPGMFARGGIGGGAVEETRDLSRVARQWEAAPGIQVAHTEAFLKWRLLDHPYHRHRVAVLTREGIDEGALAWREEAGPAGTVDIHVVDIFLKHPDPDALAAWLATAARHWRGRPARILFRTLSTGPCADAARRVAPPWLGRRNAQGATALLVLADARIVAADWWVTMLLAQGI